MSGLFQWSYLLADLHRVVGLLLGGRIELGVVLARATAAAAIALEAAGLALLSLGLCGLLLGLLLAKTLLLVRGGVGVEAEHDLLVLERVLLLDVRALGDGTTTDGAKDALDLRAVDELVEVGLGHAVLGDEEVALELRGLGGAAVDGVKGGEGVGRPDNETAKVSTRGELEEVEGVDAAEGVIADAATERTPGP